MSLSRRACLCLGRVKLVLDYCLKRERDNLFKVHLKA